MIDYMMIRRVLLDKMREKIKSHANRIHWTQTEIHAFQDAHLKKLLNHVLLYSSYYQKRCSNSKGLTRIIPSTKKDIMDNWDNIVCVPELTRAIAEDHLRQYRNGQITNPFFRDNYYITATGGSSGLRGLFVWDLEYFATVGYAAFRYQYLDDQKKLFNRPKKIAVLTAPTLIHASTPLFTMTLNDNDEAIHFPADLNMNELCKKLNQAQPTDLIGYSSIIIELAYHALGGSLSITPQRVSTNSEPLHSESREVVRKAWGVEINNMWGSVEMGMAGVENDEHCGLYLSDDLLIIELVDNFLQPVKRSSDVKKLLITNLFNYAFPLIRYVVDDSVYINKSLNSGYRIAKDIEGRSDDWFVYQEGIKIHPMVFRAILGQQQSIVEYQVEQTVCGAILRLILDQDINCNTLAKEISSALKNAGLTSPNIEIEILSSLPRHKETGKLKRFIPKLT